jgi:prophage DNA circulation protein
MPWQDRVTTAAYTSPSGVRTEFQFENVSVSVNKRDTIREFADFDGALVQNLGIGATSYPLLCIFSGDDHDQEADDFLNLLSEQGKGILEHPFYGRQENIVPFGPISRRDDLKTAGNQSIFEVNFVSSAAFQFPGSINAVTDQIEADLVEAEAEESEAYDAGIKIDSAEEQVSLVDNVKSQLNSVKQLLKGIAGTVQEVENEFNAGIELIENNINALVGQPLRLAVQVINLIKGPSRAASLVGATLEAYGNLLRSTISQSQGLFTPSIGNKINNQFFTAELFSNAAFIAILETSRLVSEATGKVSGQSLENFIRIEPDEIRAFTTKSEILNTINFISDSFIELTDWNDANRLSLDLIDTGGPYFFLSQANAATIGFLVQISFLTRQERLLVLGEPRNYLELCAELYGIVDNALDFFILTNDFTGDEINELPRGRTIRYYEN